MAEKIMIKDVLEMSREAKAKLHYKKCKIVKRKFFKDKKINIFKVVCSESYSDTEGHYVALWLEDSDKPFEDRYFKAKCNCEAWIYGGSDYQAKNKEFYLKGVPLVQNWGSGEFPQKTDPLLRNIVCKHVYVCLKALKENP